MPIVRGPPRDGVNTPVLLESEEIRHHEQRTKLYFNANLEGEGDLFVTTKRVLWLGSQDASRGIAVDYPSISVHAISRDPNAFPEQCLYCQLKPEDPNVDEEEAETPELRFVPPDAGHLQRMFMVFSEMAAMNPDVDMQEEVDSDQELPFQIGVGPMIGGRGWNAVADDAAMEDAESDDEVPHTNGVR
eukprot:gnl/MRDRNA2_/MRDRNA2_108622_c0_seq1.p1 gnl/MRDRNA2_/MRDRNA2_108622_c0~~gnl/MRDRNA2_/MRDRNA2_108622_c0_seq1.p1  ORF type:complete len:188 (+),score=45.19 gnl/MRDRNA2_/MRDRNA2_108622_c0_seq1:57-620(+)